MPLGPLHRRIDAVLARLESAGARRVVVLLALLLSATSVGPHRALDDYVLALIARGRGAPLGLDRGSMDLFTFTTGDAASNHRLMDVGLMLPWWTDPQLKIAFLRPVTALTHWADERLFPSSPALMHLHSLAWFAALLFAVGTLFARVGGSPRAAGLAFLIYALDDAHGPTVAWLANRNALIAGTFGVLAVVFHDAWRKRGWRPGAIASALALLAALLAGELAIGAVAYLVAYAVFVDDEKAWLARAKSLVPAFSVVVAWRLCWLHAGYGAAGSAAYVDPLANPVAFVAELPLRIAVLLLGQFSVPPSDLAFLAPPPHRPLLVAVAVLTVGLVTWLLVPFVRKDRTCRFWALGMGLAVLPLGATFPSDRLLLFVGVGASALLGRLFVDAFERARRAEPFGFRGVLTASFAAVHLVEAPVLLPMRAAQMEVFAVAHDRGARAILERGAPDGAQGTTVLVAAPTVLFGNYVQAEAALTGRPRPEHLYMLSSASSPTTVERAGPRSLVLRPEHGFLYTPLERHYRAGRPMRPGDRVELSAMTATVLDVSDDGRPRAVRFDLGTDGREPVILTWRNGRFAPFALPGEGGPVTLPEEDFGKILLAAALDPT